MERTGRAGLTCGPVSGWSVGGSLAACLQVVDGLVDAGRGGEGGERGEA